MSLYRNPMLADRVRPVGVVDRFIRNPAGTIEQIITLSIVTSPEGVVGCVLSVDAVYTDTVQVGTCMLAMYPLSQQAEAQEDALLLSRKWGLSLRRATPGVGWEQVRDVDVETAKLTPTIEHEF